MPPELGRMALGWAAFLVLAAGVLLLSLTPGTPQFVVTLLTLFMGLFLGLIVVAAALWTKRRTKREEGQ